MSDPGYETTSRGPRTGSLPFPRGGGNPSFTAIPLCGGRPAETPQRHRVPAVTTKRHVVSPPPNVGTEMSATYRTERDRGIKEYREQLAELRKKWPLAFSAHDEEV